MPLPKPIVEEDAFEQISELLCVIAAGRPADRSEAVSYSSCRATLLASSERHRLPGFLLQCMSVARFRDFITLYHPDPRVRERFVRTAFAAIRESMEEPPVKSQAVSGWRM